jgi:hypothetical protein
VPVRAEGNGADRLRLADVAAGSDVLLDFARKKDGNGANESGNFLFEALGSSALLARCEDGRALSSPYSVLASWRPGKTRLFDRGQERPNGDRRA